MKKLLAIMGLLISVVSFTSCKNEFGDDLLVTPENEKTDPKTPDNPTDDPKINNVDWSKEMERSFGYDQSTGRWPSTITIHYTDGKDTTFTAYCPMTSKIEAVAEKIVDTSTPASTFNGVDPTVKLDSTEWYRESDGFYYRTITRTQKVFISTYEAVVTSTHVEAKMIKEGKELYFLHGQEPAPTKKEFTTTDGGEKERYGKNYNVEECNLALDHHLHGLYHVELQAETRVLREKEEEPTADYEIPGLERFLSASRVWNEDERHYCDVYTFECSETYFFVVVNFIYDKDKDKEERTSTITKTVAKSSVVYNEKYSSEVQGCAVYDHGNYLPAIYSWNSTGFIVAGGHSDGTVVSQDIYDTDAVNRGIKNMKKENDAKPTPIIYQRSCTVGNNGVWTVIGKTVGHTVSFTVMSK